MNYERGTLCLLKILGLRIIIGLALLALVFVGPQTPWGYAGLILVVTAFINFCPLYAIFRTSTLKK